MIDLRSDTVTHPTEGMREAMSKAVLGDDVLGDDPTVIELQEKAAKILGKDTALYVPSGTMSNIVATRTHTSPGDEIVTEAHSHTPVVFYKECTRHQDFHCCCLRMQILGHIEFTVQWPTELSKQHTFHTS